MRPLLLLSLLSASLNAQVALTPKEISDGWINLWDGETMYGWVSEGGAKWHIANGALVSDVGEYGWLRSAAAFNDYVLKVEYRTGEQGNSGIFLRSAKVGEPHKTGYELQIWNKTEKYPTGSIVDLIKANKITRPAPDKWHTYEVFHVGPRILAKLDGKKVLDLTDSRSKIGYIGLQHNKNNKIEFRNVRIRPMGLAPIFNGKNLSGWQEVKASRVEKAPQWTAKKGMLHVEQGPGQMETKTTYDDFVLQLDVRPNSKDPKRHPNSGVFFRGIPGQFWTGYESQIRNEFKDGDRTIPIDTGTGGIYHFVPARRVVPNDNTFFTKTIIARGRHISIWINGYMTADWEDPNPEGTVVASKQAITKAGVISLQAHDPTTNLDFKNIRIKSLGN